jgi:predicted dehydrogenase
MKKTNFAIIGCGMIANTHASALTHSEQVDLVGAWDLDPSRCETFCKKYDILAYSSIDDLLNDKTIDAVCICTPSLAHKEQAILALSHNKHVVLEKPMALTSEDAKEICEAAEKANKLLTVIFQSRFSKDIMYVKKLISENAFGKLCMCDLYMKYYRDPSYYSMSSWRGTIKYDGGGALMNQGIHGIDLLHFLVGDGKLLSGRVKTLVHDIEVEDSAIATIEYDCGAIGVIEASTCSSPGFRRKIEINGDKGYVIISDLDIERLYLNGEMIISNNITPHPATAASPTLESFEPHQKQIENFVAAINGKEELNVTSYDGYYAVKLIESIYSKSKEYDK